jgi:hypothetical protein
VCRRAAPTSKTVNCEGALKVLWRRITHRATPPPMCQSPPIPPPPRCPPFPQTPPFHSAPHGALPLLLPKISAYLSSKSALRVPLSASRKQRKRLSRCKIQNALMAATLPVRALFCCVLIFAGQIMSALLHAATSMYRNGPAMIAMKP